MGTCAKTREFAAARKNSYREILKLNEGALTICFKVKNQQELNASLRSRDTLQKNHRLHRNDYIHLCTAKTKTKPFES